MVRIPANGRTAPVSSQYRVKGHLVREEHGFIWLWYDEADREDLPALLDLPEIPFFEELRDGFSYGGFSETWGVHYTRAIENQLDVVHLPFVHGNSIGRGNKTLVNGPVVKWEGNRMTFYVHNTVDDGVTKPLRPAEIPNPEQYFHLQLQMPNLWQNCISDKIRIVAVFAPVDEEHTRIYIRFYQSFAKWSPFKQLVNVMSNFSNRYILHQDRRVVITQEPKKSDLRMGENLVQGDLPIVEYRKRRAELQQRNGSERN